MDENKSREEDIKTFPRGGADKRLMHYSPSNRVNFRVSTLYENRRIASVRGKCNGKLANAKRVSPLVSLVVLAARGIAPINARNIRRRSLALMWSDGASLMHGCAAVR